MGVRLKMILLFTVLSGPGTRAFEIRNTDWYKKIPCNAGEKMKEAILIHTDSDDDFFQQIKDLKEFQEYDAQVKMGVCAHQLILNIQDKGDKTWRALIVTRVLQFVRHFNVPGPEPIRTPVLPIGARG